MDFFASALDFLLPRHCLLCEDTGGNDGLCEPCRGDLPWLDRTCRHCALPLPRDSDLCGHCLSNPPRFDRCRAAFRYAPPVDRLVGQFKNQRWLPAGGLLTRLLAERLRQSGEPMPEAIAAVPLHWRRQLRRGFNQAAFVAEKLATELNIPLVKVAKRRQPTAKQQQLGRRERLRNLQDAFVARPEFVGDRHLAIVDDVVTTGATTEALSQQLKKAGARRVEVWALARTPAPEFP